MSNPAPRCSCIICHKEYSEKGLIQHINASHTADKEERKLLRSKRAKQNTYKSSETNNIIKCSRIELYLLSPKICTHCETTLPYDFRHNKFCSSNCAATFNNKLRPHKSPSRLKQSLSLKKQKKIQPGVKPKFSKLFLNTCICCSTQFYSNRVLKTCSDICYKQNLSNTAKRNPSLGGNKNNKAYGWYESPSAGKVWLESSYEAKLAKELDSLNINWNRPNGLKYTIDGKTKTYYPDFYIQHLNVYIDPKNDYLIPLDIPKISAVESQHEIRVIILSKRELSYSHILNILDTGFEPARALLPVAYKATAVNHLANPEC